MKTIGGIIGIVIWTFLLVRPAVAIPPCTFIQWAVGKYGLDEAIQWARDKGYSEQDIAEARKCVAPTIKPRFKAARIMKRRAKGE